MNLFTKHKETYIYKKQTYGYPRGNMGERDKSGAWDEYTHITVRQISNKGPPVQHRDSTQYSVITIREKNWKKNEYMYMYN